MGSDYYRYGSLAPWSIRLFGIVPSPSGLYGDLLVNLEEHSLDGAEFDALSYTWGPSSLEEEQECAEQVFTNVKRCYPLFCDGAIILVTKSLRDATRRLRALECDPRFERQYGRRKLPLTWADGVCINQNDDEERAQQVLHMGKIYSQSNLMFGYLGEDTKDVQNAIAIGAQLRKILEDDDGSRCSHQEGYERWEQRDKALFNSSRWWDWVLFLSRSWFQRTWVLQEIILSGSEKSFLLCGSTFSDLETVLQGAFAVRIKRWTAPLQRLLTDTAHENPTYQLYLPKFMEWASRTHVLVWIGQIWRVDQKPSFRSVTRSLLPQTYCSDPRDKIYGTLSFIADWRDLNQHILPINYSLSTTEVYSRATKHVLNTSKNLDLICSVATRRDEIKKFPLPSWCPDFQQVGPTPEPFTAAHATQDSFCSASGSCSNDFGCLDLDTPLYLLQVRGHFCGTVVEHTSTQGFPTSTANKALFGLLLANIHHCENSTLPTNGFFTSFLRVIYTYGTSRLKASELPFDDFEASVLGHAIAVPHARRLWDTKGSLTFDYVEKEILEFSQVIQELVMTDTSFASWLPYAIFLRQELDFVKKATELPEEFRFPDFRFLSRLPEVPEGFSTHLQSAIPAILGACSDRHLFRTSAGRIGLSHDTLQVTDQVWLLAGSKTPVLLRPAENRRFEFIGEAYVDGLMFGEEWPESDDRLSEVSII